MKFVKNRHGPGKPLLDGLHIGSPHITADDLDFLATLLPQFVKESTQGFLGAIRPSPKKPHVFDIMDLSMDTWPFLRAISSMPTYRTFPNWTVLKAVVHHVLDRLRTVFQWNPKRSPHYIPGHNPSATRQNHTKGDRKRALALGPKGMASTFTPQLSQATRLGV